MVNPSKDHFVNPIFWLTREVLLPWLYHLTHVRNYGWLLVCLPLWLVALVFDVAVSVAVLLIEFVALALYTIFFFGSFACCDRWCRTDSRCYWPTVTGALVGSWTSWRTAFRFTTYDTLLVDRDALDSATYFVSEHPKFRRFIRECFTSYFAFYLTRKWYVSPSDDFREKRRRPCYILGLLILFPFLIASELITMIVWWISVATLFPAFVPFWFLTAGCCHRRWTTIRVAYYYVVFLVALMAVYLFALLVALTIVDPLIGAAFLAGYFAALINLGVDARAAQQTQEQSKPTSLNSDERSAIVRSNDIEAAPTIDDEHDEGVPKPFVASKSDK